eukprot:366372-Chlamydomonas_euryale.AAC.9
MDLRLPNSPPPSLSDLTSVSVSLILRLPHASTPHPLSPPRSEAQFFGPSLPGSQNLPRPRPVALYRLLLLALRPLSDSQASGPLGLRCLTLGS